MNKRPAVHPDLPIGDALRAVARDILGEANAAITDPGRTSAIAVHDYRKAMKRWRALLRLLGPFLGEIGEKLRVEARDLARELAGARDVQAALDALSDLEKAEVELSPRSVATMRNRLEAMRHAAEATSLTLAMRARLAAALSTAIAAVALWQVGQVRFAEVAAELAGTYRRMRNAVPKDWLAAPAEELHDLRRFVVAHRYQMELVEPLWPRLGRLWTDEAQRLRERLGHHHDLEVLASLTEPRKALAPWRSRLAPLIADRQADHVKAAARLAGRLLAEKPKAFRRRLEALWQSRGAEDD